MKNRLLVATLIVGLCAHTKAEKIFDSSLEHATIYTQGAMLSHKAQVNLERGNQTIWIKDVSKDVDEQSLTVFLPASSTLISVSPRRVSQDRVNYSSADLRILDSLQTYNQKKNSLQNEIATEDYGVSLLKKNDQLFQSKEGEMADVLKAYAEYKKLLKASYETKVELSKELEKTEMVIARLRERIKERGLEAKTETIIELVLQNASSSTANLELHYYTPSSYWQPSYIISNEDAAPNLDLEYKARVFQNTGFDWHDVALSISTSNPNRSSHQPVLSTWFLRQYQAYRNQGYSSYSNMGKRIPQVEMADMEELDGVKEKSRKAVPIANANTTVTNTVFDMDVRFDVKSGNVPILANLKEYHIPAEIYFYAVPKLDKDVYLLAAFSFDQATELIPGEALILNDGQYVGKTQLNPYEVSDTMRLSLGRSPNVQVKREEIENMCTNSFLGNKKTTQKYYEFKLYNGLARPIDLIVKDQYPKSTMKDVTVTLLEKENGVDIDDTGILTWDMELSPRQNKSFKFGYEVKYPKKMKLAGI